MKNGFEISKAEALVRLLSEKINIPNFPSEKLTDRNKQKVIDPIVLWKSVTGHQPDP